MIKTGSRETPHSVYDFQSLFRGFLSGVLGVLSGFLDLPGSILSGLLDLPGCFLSGLLDLPGCILGLFLGSVENIGFYAALEHLGSFLRILGSGLKAADEGVGNAVAERDGC